MNTEKAVHRKDPSLYFCHLCDCIYGYEGAIQEHYREKHNYFL